MGRFAARLDAAIQDAIDSYVDPWDEADAPAYPEQFTPLVTIGAPWRWRSR